MATMTTFTHNPPTLNAGAAARLAARANAITLTPGLAPGFIQANLIVIPSCYADDFRLLCARNPVPCPLLAESSSLGSFSEMRSYIQGITGAQIAASIDEWTSDHVAFLIGCSYSFEAALAAADLAPRHTSMQRNVPMYRTNVPLCPAGVTRGSTYVVSMRPYRRDDVERIRSITRPFVTTHGQPIAWGLQAVNDLAIKDIDTPEWGDNPLTLDGNPFSEEEKDIVPVFWGCDVTPQEAVMRANLEGTVMGHAPGHMVVLDIREDQVFSLPFRNIVL